jgi:hypothetical protein
MLAGALGAAAAAAVFLVAEAALEDKLPGHVHGSDSTDTASTAASAGSGPATPADIMHADLAAELGRLREQLQAMEQDARRARDALARRLTVAEQRMQPMPDAAGSISDADSHLQEADAAPEAVAMSLDDAFADEPRDAGWALETEESLYRQLSTPDIGVSALAMIECRTSLCAIEGLHEDNAGQERFMDEFPALLEEGMSGYVHTDIAADGRPVTRIYLARMGFGLPEMP